MEKLNQEQLYKMLDIEEAADFQYFENLAELLECEEEIEENVLFNLMSQVNKDSLAELVHNYFEEVTDFLPNDATELFTLLDNIKFSLIGMARNCSEDSVLINLVDELERFRKWYSVESRVQCNSVTGEFFETMPLRDAIVLARTEKILGENYEYDFTYCLDYPIEEYVMSFADLAVAAEADADSYSDEDDMNNPYDADNFLN